MINEIYLRRRGRVIVPQGAEKASPQILLSLLANVQSLGYTLSSELLDRLGTLSLPELKEFHDDLMLRLQELVGDRRKFKPMYPNFPEQVMRASSAELYFNAIIHYWTNALPVFSIKKRPALDEPVVLRPIELGSQAELEEILTLLVARPGSLSATDASDVVKFIASFSDDAVRLLSAEIPARETIALVAAALLTHTNSGEAFVKTHVKNVTDVLRLAVALSGGDISLALNTKFASIPRGRRKLLLEALEACPNLEEDMLRWKGRWIRLGERLHPGEFATRFPKSFQAFKTLREDQPVPRFSSRLEFALEQGNVTAAVTLLRSRPGMLARRLDHVLRLEGDHQQLALEAFGAVAADVSTQVLLQVWGHFKFRNQGHDLRIFFPKGNVGKVQAIPDALPKLDEAARERVLSTVEEALVQRFAHLPPLGNCYLDPELRRFPVPFGQRSASKALATLPRGSRLTLPEAKVVRLFLWWKNGKYRTDIDLSAAFYNEKFLFIDLVSYYNLRSFNCGHSGDIVDAPEGAAEYIDLTLESLRQQEVRYVVMSVNSYTEQPFRDLPECYAGWMSREKPQDGEIFEPATVQNRVDLAGDTTISLPLILDLVTNEVIWSDLALKKHPMFNNVHNNEAGVSLMLRSMTQLRRMSLYDLFEIHVRARGSKVDTREGTETVFGLDDGITPYQVDRIATDFM